MAMRRMLSTALAAGLLLVAAVPASAAPEPCIGAGAVGPTEAPSVSFAGGVTFVEFDFAGVHPICLADGTQVVAPVHGHLWQRIYSDGSVFLRFEEVLEWDGGQLEYRGNATFNGSGWNSAVRTVGNATGALAGIQGHGTFSPIDPVTGAFTDEISYVYR